MARLSSLLLALGAFLPLGRAGKGTCQDQYCHCQPPYFRCVSWECIVGGPGGPASLDPNLTLSTTHASPLVCSIGCSRSKAYPANYSMPSPANFKIYMCVFCGAMGEKGRSQQAANPPCANWFENVLAAGMRSTPTWHMRMCPLLAGSPTTSFIQPTLMYACISKTCGNAATAKLSHAQPAIEVICLAPTVLLLQLPAAAVHGAVPAQQCAHRGPFGGQPLLRPSFFV